MDTKGKHIARPVHRLQVDALFLVVPVSRKRADGHNEKSPLDKQIEKWIVGESK
jgi:hypothetical protein